MERQIGYVNTSENDLVYMPWEIFDETDRLGEYILRLRILEKEIVGSMGYYCAGNNSQGQMKIIKAP